MNLWSLTPELSKPLKDYLKKDPLTNIFLLQGINDPSPNVEFRVATEGTSVMGALMIAKRSDRSFVWLISGSNEAGQELVRFIDVRNGSILASLELKKTLEELFEKRKDLKLIDSYQMDVMRLDELKVDLEMKHAFKRLDANEFRRWARSANQGGEPTPDEEGYAKQLLKTAIPFVIYNGDEIVSRAAVDMLSSARLVRSVYTDEKFRGRGYATSVISAAVEEGLRRGGPIMLFCRSDNMSAKKIYEKMGFETVAAVLQYDFISS